MGKRTIGFMDETGVLSDKSTQRFFALGLLKFNNSWEFYNSLWKLKNQAESYFNENELKKLQKPFEFKFYLINNTNFEFFFKLIDLYFSFPEVKFCCFIIDKDNPKVDMRLYDTWEYYIKYSLTLIKNNLDADEESFIIADYLGKPNASDKYWEQEICSIPNIFNAIMIESHCSLFNQVVDVLIGAIAYAFKVERQGHKYNLKKYEISNYVRDSLGVKSLVKNHTLKRPNYFSIWEFKPYE